MPLKLHADAPTHLNTVTAYGPGFVEINKIRHAGSLVVTPEHPVQRWSAASFDALSGDDFSALLSFGPELVIFGSGGRQRFPAAALTAALRLQGIGFEAMDTAAACRTYNILMAEGRRVLAAILQD